MSQFWNNHDEFQHDADLFTKDIGSRQFFNAIEQELPPVFTRQTASKAIGGLISVKHLVILIAYAKVHPLRCKWVQESDMSALPLCSG